MAETEEFAQKAIQIGNNNKQDLIAEYGKQLLAAIESFNFDKIEEMVDLFAQIQEKVNKEILLQLPDLGNLLRVSLLFWVLDWLPCLQE